MKAKWSHAGLGLVLSLSARESTAAIRAAVSEHHQLTRGDQITFAISADNELEARWFSRGENICKGPTCAIDTGEFLPGEYRLDVVVPANGEVDVGHFSFSLEASPPVYQVKELAPALVPINRAHYVLHIGANDLWLSAIQGRLTQTEKKFKATVQSTVPSPVVLRLNAIARVPFGSIAAAGRFNAEERLLIQGPAELRRLDMGIELHSGKFLWRRVPKTVALDTPSSPAPFFAKVPLTPTAFVSATQTGDTYLHTGVNGNHSAVDVFAIGSDVNFLCGADSVTIPESTRMTILYDATATSCKVFSHETNRDRVDLADFYKNITKHWFGKTEKDLALLWLKNAVSEDIAISVPQLARPFVEAKQWGTVLDLTSSVEASKRTDFDWLYTQGLAFAGIGLLEEAEVDFLKADELKPEDPNPAFQLGRLKFLQKKFIESMNWYELSARRGYVDLPSAMRGAARSAESAGLLRTALRDSEAARLSETDAIKTGTDAQNRDRLQRKRYLSGKMEGIAEMQSHILPVDPEKYGDLPNLATTNRSAVFGVKAQWQHPFPTPKTLDARITGQHDYIRPLNASLGIASHSDNVFKLRVKSIDPVIGIDTDLSAATLLRSGGRQVDVFGAKLGAAGGSNYLWNASLISARAFDPAPGGADLIDARLNRLVGPADHSHFDFGLTAGIGSSWSDQSWQFQTAYQTIDFRTGIMDDYDGTEFTNTATYIKQFGQRWRGEITANQWQRSFSVRGKDQEFALDTMGTFTFAPLWDVSVSLGYFSRAASDDEVVFQGHHYGMGLSVLL